MLHIICSPSLALRQALIGKPGSFLSTSFLCVTIEVVRRTSGQACNGNEQLIIHGWARNAPSMNLPEGQSKELNSSEHREIFSDVGFPVGRNTPYKFIVVNIHYLPIVKNDKSGNQLMMSRKPYVLSLSKPIACVHLSTLFS